MGSDIVFDSAFAPTMTINEDDGKADLDWDAFHQVVDAPFNQRQIVASSHS